MDNTTTRKVINALASKEIKEPILINNVHGGSLATVSGSVLGAVNASVVHDEITRNLEENHSDNNIARVQTRRSRISLFQG